jgi:hypothetical protein
MKKLLILALLVLFTGCYQTDLVFEDQYRIVVESYLYVGTLDRSVTLTSMISFGNDSTGGEGIADALVTLTGNSGEWVFKSTDSGPGNYILESGPELVPGDTLQLRVEILDQRLHASTVIPAPPPPVTMSSSSMTIPKVEDMTEFHDIEWPDPIELTWDNPQGESYFIRIENIESNPGTIRPDPPDDLPGDRMGFVFQKVSQPTSGESFLITPMELTHYGTHRVVFFHVNEEYADLYRSLEQDSHELNEPFTNVKNGLGIFTAFNSDTLYFEVKP